MTIFPLDLAEIFGHAGQYLIFLLIGIGFGIVLEMAGFGISTRLAGQFYFREQTVLKVMFGAIIVAMVLIFGTVAIGLLDYNQIWVHPTYLIPGIIGGLIMGVGFIIGGFCPGTALVASATLKIDGIFFTLGAFFGIFFFGETVGLFDDFWHSTFMGRITLPQLFGMDVGIVVVLVVIVALIAFLGAEVLEQRFGGKDRKLAPKWRYGAGATLLIMAGAVMFIGQPTSATKWSWVEAEKAPLLEKRTVMVSPAEVLDYMHDDSRLQIQLIDVRDEADFNSFHLANAEHVPLANLLTHLPEWQVMPSNHVILLISNDETAAIEGWKMLVVENVPNVYILAGGINGWIKEFHRSSDGIDLIQQIVADDQFAYVFASTNSDLMPLARPRADFYSDDIFGSQYTPKIVPQGRSGATSGGCG